MPLQRGGVKYDGARLGLRLHIHRSLLNPTPPVAIPRSMEDVAKNSGFIDDRW